MAKNLNCIVQCGVKKIKCVEEFMAKQIILKMDGEVLCAVWDDFKDSITSSVIGFGSTVENAILDLLAQTPKGLLEIKSIEDADPLDKKCPGGAKCANWPSRCAVCTRTEAYTFYTDYFRAY